MSIYAKINENGVLEYAPRDKDGVSNWGLDEQNLLNAGYLPLKEIIIPEDKVLIGYVIEDGFIVPKLEDVVLTYVDMRRKEYPPIEDQLDMIYWDRVNNTNVWQETISTIKAKYPKPQEEETVQEE